MAILNSWQRIDRVSSGLPFGNGADGAYSSATIPTLVKLSVTGVATETHIHATTANFVANDVILLHQTRGTGVGQWEINKISADNGDGTYTLSTALQYTYTDSGASQAQVIKIPQYTDCTVQSGTWTVPAWDGNVGGILPLAIKGTLTVTGTITATSVGFAGGAATPSAGENITATQGEGTAAAGSASRNANANGGGGGFTGTGQPGGGAGGGGGAYGADGADGSSGGGNSLGGLKGGSTGSADLTSIVFGGGGGGGSRDDADASLATAGTAGGGIVLIFSKATTITGAIVTNSSNSGNVASPYNAGSGGTGAGGAVAIVGQTVTLGTALITATTGTAGTGGSGTGGKGGVGRIAVHHSGAVTGTTTPTFTDVTDATLVEGGGGAFLLNFI